MKCSETVKKKKKKGGERVLFGNERNEKGECECLVVRETERSCLHFYDVGKESFGSLRHIERERETKESKPQKEEALSLSLSFSYFLSFFFNFFFFLFVSTFTLCCFF
ncbi:hypothetical protein ACB098_05G093000 [Castanea mollissima]